MVLDVIAKGASLKRQEAYNAAKNSPVQHHIIIAQLLLRGPLQPDQALLYKELLVCRVR